jgi:hypothetical protein
MSGCGHLPDGSFEHAPNCECFNEGPMPVIKPTQIYKHMNKRVLNLHSGSLGTIIKAEKRGKTSWEIKVVFDNSPYHHTWSPRDLFQHNELVADDYEHHLPPAKGRALFLVSDTLLAELKKAAHGVYGNYISRVQKAWDEVNKRGGMDAITYCPSFPATLNISLWGVRKADHNLSVDYRDIYRDPQEDKFDVLAAALKKKVVEMPEAAQ